MTVIFYKLKDEETPRECLFKKKPTANEVKEYLEEVWHKVEDWWWR